MEGISVNQRQLRIFGLLLSLVICAWVSYFFIKSASSDSIWWVGYFPAAGLALLALLKPNALKGFFKLWMRIVEALNKILSDILMTIVFICIITPSALIRRLTGHNALFNDDFIMNSYRIKSEPLDSKDMEKPY